MPPLDFTHEAHPARVVFGDGCRRRLAEEVDRLGVRRALVIASPRLGAEVAALLGARAAVALGGGVMHVPVEIAASASATAAEAGADGIVAVGGGSAIGLAKAIARGRGLPDGGRPDGGLPIVAVPTTYAGSEMTSIWGQTEGGQKRTGRDERVRPKTVLYDPELTDALPAELAAQSGLNAVAHAMEALYTPKLDPVIALLAEEAVAALARALPLVVDDGAARDRAARSGALYGAWLAGVCLDRATMGVHHKLCHVLGGSFGLPHAAVHAVILPYAAAFNCDAAPEAMRRLARALGADVSEAPAALFALGRRLQVPASLAAIGMRRGDLDRAAELATQSPYDNPRPVDRAGVRALLEEAFGGLPPATQRQNHAERSD
jgi:maleylacetate reductase